MNGLLKTMYSCSLEKKANKLLGSIKNRMEHNMEIIIMPLGQSETHQSYDAMSGSGHVIHKDKSQTPSQHR